MKTRLKLWRGLRGGYALMMVMVITSISIIVLAATLSRTTGNAYLNEYSNEHTVALNAAEAATEKVVARMIVDYPNGGDARLTNNLELYRKSIPTTTENTYWSNFRFTDGQGTANRNYVQVVSNKVYTALSSQFQGLYGFRTTYRVVSNARQPNSSVNVTAACQQEIETDSIPVFQFAIFYNSLLEFTWAAPMTVRGRTHANGHIFVGSAWPLVFQNTVTTTGVIQKKSWGGYGIGSMTGSITYQGSPTYRTNVAALSLPIGTNNSAAAVREIVNVPPAGEDVNSAMGKERFYNKAGLIILVSNATVTALFKSSPADATVISNSFDFAGLSTNLPFLNLTNTFMDQREGDWMKTTEIDIGSFGTWSATNLAVAAKFSLFNPLNILYVMDNRSTNATTNTALRLVNGQTIPTNLFVSGGLTVSTPNPLYVKGHYNCPNTSHLGGTNTTQTQPASLISDALTVLSINWTDSDGTNSLTSSARDAGNTTVNAAILTGVVYSGGASGTAPFSGGVHNLPRLLEDWGSGSVTLTLNTSIVNFFNSVKATGPFQLPGGYYYAPTRNINFDQNFTNPNKLPPGTPMLGVMLRAKWRNPPPNTVTYAGN